MMEGKRRHLTNSQGRWVRNMMALVMMVVGYLTFQLCLIALNTISCSSYDIDEFRTMSSNFLITHRPVHKAPEHSTIICQLDETHSDFDRRCHTSAGTDAIQLLYIFGMPVVLMRYCQEPHFPVESPEGFT
jgi:hypothetical protein